MTQVKVLQTTIIELVKPPHPLTPNNKREIILHSFDDLKRVARKFAKGVIYHYFITRQGKTLEVFEVEGKFTVFRLYERGIEKIEGY